MLSDDTIPISLIRQHSFCPRIPYFVEVLGVKTKHPIWVEQGDYHHVREDRLFKRRNLTRFGLSGAKVSYAVPVEDDKLGINGIADAVLIGEGKGAVIEFKISRASIHEGAKLQLAAYSICAEKTFGCPFEIGFFVVGPRGKILPQRIDGRLRQKLAEVLVAMRANFNRPTLPHTSAASAQCSQCEYLTRCNDRD